MFESMLGAMGAEDGEGIVEGVKFDLVLFKDVDFFLVLSFFLRPVI